MADALARRRSIVPPEGVPLHLNIAQAGDRAAAFLFDMLIQVLLIGAVLLVIGMTSGSLGEISIALVMLYVFCVRSFYFIWFETRSRGQTPGKKRVRIRVIDARGGPLRTDAIVARNLMREVEVWIPVLLVFLARDIWPGAPGWARLLFSLWAIGLGFFPLFNRDRLRAGDLVAGTLVVDAPEAVLLPDLGGQEVVRARRSHAARVEPEYAFTDPQLDVYGIYELQVLEDLLRRSDPNRKDAMRVVAKQIVEKVGWTGPKVRPERFLRAFYAALRARLEHRMLLGKRKRDKYSD